MDTGRARCRQVLYALLAAVMVLATRGTDAQPASTLPRLVADYINGLVDELSFVVAQEDFTFKWTRKTVRSDVLLAGYPGSDRRLLPFRDVTHVNGTPLPDRDAHRFGLFQPTNDARRQALDIARDGNQYVPLVLNPFWVIAFLQAEYQPRFRLAEKAPGRDWPAGVKALTFEERSRPTLLRGGAKGTANAPVKGTAWIDTATGRILQTQLFVNDGGKVSEMLTRFGRDERLRMMVPIEMVAYGPDGTATYSNFRRWDVTTGERLEVPPEPR